MKLSAKTLSILKNFSLINQNMVFRPEQPIKTISEAGHLLAIGPMVDFEFEEPFGIYDLSEFISTVNLFNEPDITLETNYMVIKENKKRVKYFFSNPEFLTFPEKDIKMPKAEVSFFLPEGDLLSLKQASSTLGVTDLVFENDGTSDSIVAYVTDTNDKTSNSFSINLSLLENDSVLGVPFKFVTNIADLKFISDTYKVNFSSKFIAQFIGESLKTQYFLGLDKKMSTYPFFKRN